MTAIDYICAAIAFIMIQTFLLWVAFQHGKMLGFLAGRQAEQEKATNRIVNRTRERAAWFSQN